MRILYLSQYFPPEMGAPAARVHELSREWAALGHDVTVLTGFPHHPTGVIPEAYRGQWLRREVVDGVRVLRAPIYAAANKGVLRRSLSYGSYALSASLLGPLLAERPDVLIATSPQFLTGLAGLWLSTALRVPFVFEVRDLWPRSIVEVGALAAGSPAVRALEALERLLYRRADHIVVVSPAFAPEIEKHGIPRDRISVVTNGVDLGLFSPRDKAQARRALRLPEGFVASYVGTHGMAHGLGTLLEAAARLKGRARFLLVGEGAEKAALKDRAHAMGLDDVIFWDQRPRDEVAQVLAASDVCLVLLKGAPLFKTVIPSKLFEILGAGRPILTNVDGEARRLAEASGAGRFCPPDDAEALAAALDALARDPAELDRMGQRGRAWVAERYSRPALARQYLDVLQKVIR
jgi:glycosyltransferase involved in cell wall biosynthesis